MTKTLREATRHLQAVQDPGPNNADFNEMLAECFEASDYQAFLTFKEREILATPPEWRAMPVLRLLESTIKHSDLKGFRSFEPYWTELPETAHRCECEQNEYWNFKAYVSLAEDRLDSIPECLKNAQDVHGCPHLNSGGFKLDVVRMLIDRGQFVDDCRAYIEKSLAFRNTEAA